MPEAFRSFAAILCEQPALAVPSEAPLPNAIATDAPPAPDPRVADLLETFVADFARLSARAAERLEERAEALLGDLARHVLGRELLAAPSDLGLLIEDLVTEFGLEPPLLIRVSNDDAQRWRASRAVQPDPLLAPGDAVVHVDDGEYDLKLQTRLQGLLASYRVAL